MQIKFWGQQNHWNYDQRNQAFFEDKRYNGFDHSEELAGSDGMHLHLWVPEGTPMEEILKAAEEACNHRDYVHWSYGIIPS